jgi:hypothetical protein
MSMSGMGMIASRLGIGMWNANAGKLQSVAGGAGGAGAWGSGAGWVT